MRVILPAENPQSYGEISRLCVLPRVTSIEVRAITGIQVLRTLLSQGRGHIASGAAF